MALAELDNLAIYQHGVVTTDQARDYMTDHQWRHLIRRGHLVPVRRGVYRTVGCEPNSRQEVTAAVLSIGLGTVASHQCAARLWGLEPGFDDAGVELTMPPRRSVRRGGIRFHRSIVAMTDVTTIGCITVTTVARTLVDLASSCSIERLEAAVDDALRRKLTTLQELSECFALVRRPGRPRCKRFADLLAARLESATQSHLERKVLRHIKRRRLPKPVAQHRVSNGLRTFHLDFAWPKQKVVLEVQGYKWHGQRSAFRPRQSALCRFGSDRLGRHTNHQRHAHLRPRLPRRATSKTPQRLVDAASPGICAQQRRPDPSCAQIRKNPHNYGSQRDHLHLSAAGETNIASDAHLCGAPFGAGSSIPEAG